MYPSENPDSADENEQPLIKLFGEWDNDLEAHWTDWRKDAKEDFEYFAGRSWTDDERKQLEQKGRIPVEFNRANPLLKSVSGAEINARQRVNYSQRTQGDAQVNEMLTQAAEHFREENDAPNEETEAFQHRNICGIGVIETRIDEARKGRADIVIQHCDPLEFDIDPSAYMVNAIDAEYIRRRRFYSLRNAKKTVWR